MQHWGQIWYHYRASITGTFVFYRNSTSRNLYHDNSSSKNDKKYILRTSVHRRHGGHWMSTIAPAGNYITNWSRHLSCLSILNHSILHLSIHSNSNPHKQVKAIRYAIAVFSFSPPPPKTYAHLANYLQRSPIHNETFRFPLRPPHLLPRNICLPLLVVDSPPDLYYKRSQLQQQSSLLQDAGLLQRNQRQLREQCERCDRGKHTV